MKCKSKTTKRCYDYFIYGVDEMPQWFKDLEPRFGYDKKIGSYCIVDECFYRILKGEYVVWLNAIEFIDSLSKEHFEDLYEIVE